MLAGSTAPADTSSAHLAPMVLVIYHWEMADAWDDVLWSMQGSCQLARDDCSWVVPSPSWKTNSWQRIWRRFYSIGQVWYGFEASQRFQAYTTAKWSRCSKNGQVRALSDFRVVIHHIDRHYRQECERMAGWCEVWHHPAMHSFYDRWELPTNRCRTRTIALHGLELIQLWSNGCVNLTYGR